MERSNLIYVSINLLLKERPRYKQVCTFSATSSHTVWVSRPKLLWPHVPNNKERELLLPGGPNLLHPTSEKGKWSLAGICISQAAEQGDLRAVPQETCTRTYRSGRGNREGVREGTIGKIREQEYTESPRTKEGKGNERQELPDRQEGR